MSTSPSKRTCSTCGTQGHTKRSCKAPAPVRMDQPLVEELEWMKEVFERPSAQRCLVSLYSDSQSECMRNGTPGMEIGMAREKDQVTVLKMCLKDKVNLCIDNSRVEDCEVGSGKVSIKHTTGKVGAPVKAKWTSADKSVQEAIQAMLDADDSYYPHLLLTYFDTEANRITIVCIAKDQNKATIKELGAAAFTVPKGNSRGIEYSRAAMALLLQRMYFSVTIEDANVNGGEDPIERRMKRLQSLGLSPE